MLSIMIMLLIIINLLLNIESKELYITQKLLSMDLMRVVIVFDSHPSKDCCLCFPIPSYHILLGLTQIRLSSILWLKGKKMQNIYISKIVC